MYDLLSQSSIRNSYPMATHNSFKYKRLGRGDQGNVKNETSVSNGNRENGKKRQIYEVQRTSAT